MAVVTRKPEAAQIAATRKKYYDAIAAGYSREDAADFAQSDTEELPAKQSKKSRAKETAPEPLKSLKRVKLTKSEPEAEEEAPKDETEGDDLTRINGIGSGTARKLNNWGIFKYAQIASWNPKQAEEYDTKLGYRGRVQREDWVGQAQAMLAEE